MYLVNIFHFVGSKRFIKLYCATFKSFVNIFLSVVRFGIVKMLRLLILSVVFAKKWDLVGTFRDKSN